MKPSTELPPLEEVLAEQAKRSLLRFVPYLSPRYSSPTHLAKLVDRFERAVRGEAQFVVAHAPPRHAKTETVLHLFPWALLQKPALTFSYTTYADRLARSKSRKAIALVERAGIRLASRTLNEWRTVDGGGLLAGGIRGPLTGHGVNIAIVDDAVKNRMEAESPVQRENNWEWFNDVLFSRVESGAGVQGSVFVFMTRWHPDDLSGRLIKEGWEYIRLPAINDEGEALWPERRPLSSFERQRRQPYTWASIYQGEPRPRGGQVFDPPKVYTELPRVFTPGIGLDLAYTAKTSSDWSAVVTMLKDPSTGWKYVVDVARRQTRPSIFRKVLRNRHRRYPSARMLMYTSTTEQGIIDIMADGDDGLPIHSRLAKADKFVRAQAYAGEWNAGRVLVPKTAPWLDDFVSEHLNFTGVDDPEDDQVDAAVAANDVLDDGADIDIPTKPPKAKRTGLSGMDM